LWSKTPDKSYQGASGGSAMIVNKYGAKEKLPIALSARGSADQLQEA
jgi:hypothetical protein